MAVAEILGREAEVQAVGRFLRGPAPAALVLEGPAGIVKTTVWRAGLEDARGLGHRVLVTRPSEVETAPAMAGLMDLLGEVFDEHGDVLPAPQRSALAVALLRETRDHAEVQPGAVSAAALALLRQAAEASPVVVAIDDLQWLDRATAATLTFALRRLGEASVLLLATARSEDGAQDARPASISGQRMLILPLDIESLSRLIARELGQRLPWPVVRRIAYVAAGNALLAIELARVATLSGDDADELSPAALSRSSHVRRLAEARVRVLPEPTRKALAIVAALGEPRAPTLSRALHDEAALDPAFDAGVIGEQGGRVRFTHPLLAAGALTSLSPWRRRSIHRALADLADTSEERARHLAVATTEPSAEIACAIDDGAADALSRGAPSAAAQLLEEAVRLTPAADGSAMADRLVRAGISREQAGDAMRALELVRRAIRESPPGSQRARARVWVAGHEHVPLQESMVQLRVALGECGTDDAARAKCQLGIGMVLMLAGDWRTARRHLAESVHLSEPLDDEELQVTALAEIGHLDERMAPGSGRAALQTAARMAAGRLIPWAGMCPDALLATVHYWADELEPARALLLGVRERAVAAGDEQGVADVGTWLTELEARAGNLQCARTYADESIAILDLDRHDQNLGTALFGRALVAAYEGDEDLTRGLVARGMTICDSMGDRIFDAKHRTVLGFLELSLDRPVEAVQQLMPVHEQLQEMGVKEPGAFPHCNDLLEALIGSGSTGQAECLRAEMTALGRELDRPRLLCAALRGEALLAARRGDQETAEKLLGEALEIHGRLPVPLERGRTLLALGMAHRRAKHRRAARERLREAEGLFEQMGARIWRDRARREIGRISGRTASDRNTLTPTERQIAELVASGRTNREVAQELFVSPHTVESNLTRIYRKLGVRSRAELAAGRRLM
jgi:DNA-binding CsgD family transcriptional regulator